MAFDILKAMILSHGFIALGVDNWLPNSQALKLLEQFKYTAKAFPLGETNRERKWKRRKHVRGSEGGSGSPASAGRSSAGLYVEAD